jgi:hypothetical protein
MNFAGHIAVALRHRDTAPGDRTSRPVAAIGDRPVGRMAATAGQAFLIGAALPDLAAMGRFRLLERPGDDEMADGVDLHHRTDDVFHRHPWFRANSAAVTRGLERAGLSRGAARACGHVGVELLLDGHLLTRHPDLGRSVRSTIEGAGARADDLAELVADGQRPGWRQHLARLAEWPVPDDYHRPSAVAARLQRILSRRPRLAFRPEQVGVVTDVLAERQPDVVAGADPLLGDLLDGLGR